VLLKLAHPISEATLKLIMPGLAVLTHHPDNHAFSALLRTKHLRADASTVLCAAILLLLKSHVKLAISTERAE
jgi:hypothetical protein